MEKMLERKIDRNNPLPLYYQLKNLIKTKIESGELIPGDLLEPEWEICQKHNLSRNTVRRAMADLKNEGLIYQIPGKGTFVSSPKISHRFVTVVSFTEELLARGMKPSSKLLKTDIIPADQEVAGKLEIKEGDSVYLIHRLRFGDDKLLGLNISRIPMSVCPGLLDYDLTEGSLNTIIENQYGHQIVKVLRVLETIPADDEISEKLGITKGVPVLSIQGISYNQHKIPIECCNEYYID